MSYEQGDDAPLPPEPLDPTSFWETVPTSPPAEDAPSRRPFSAIRVATGALAVYACTLAMLEGGTAAYNALTGHGDAKAPKAPIDCPAPRQASIDAVTKLFDKRPDVFASYEAYLPTERRIRRDRRMLAHIDTGTPAGFGRLIATANEQLKDYDVTLRLTPKGVRSPLLDTAVTPPNDKRFYGSRISKLAVERIVSQIENLPKSYVRYSGLKQVFLYRQHASKDETAVYAYVQSAGPYAHNAVHMNIAYAYHQDTVAHEIYHLVDKQECGRGYSLDTPFRKLTPTSVDVRDNKTAWRYTTDTQKWHNTYNHLRQEIHDAYRQHDLPRYDTNLKEAESLLQSVYFNTQYAMTDSMEDKAELAADFADPYYFRGGLDPSTPGVRKKFLFILARLYEHAPGAVRRFATLASRPPKNGIYRPRLNWSKQSRAAAGGKWRTTP